MRWLYQIDALDLFKSSNWVFLTSSRIFGSFPVVAAMIESVTDIFTSELIPLIIPPRGLTVYIYGVPQWSARVNVLKARVALRFLRPRPFK